MAVRVYIKAMHECVEDSRKAATHVLRPLCPRFHMCVRPFTTAMLLVSGVSDLERIDRRLLVEPRPFSSKEAFTCESRGWTSRNIGESPVPDRESGLVNH